MSTPIDLSIGLTHWSLTVPEPHRVDLRRAPFTTPTASAAELTRAALEKPFEFEPLRRALTPDDRVAVVLDPGLPQIPAILGEVLTHLRSAGIPPEAVTVLTPPGSSRGWAEGLSDDFADVQAQIHDPTDKAKLAYLASTKAGRRLYLNRTLVEADFVVVVSGRGYDPLTGYAGAEAAIFPTLADEEIRNSLAGELSTLSPVGEPWPVRAESTEVAGLFGIPFLVQVIEGAGDTVQDVVAGLSPSSAEGIRREDARWHGTVSEEPDTVIAAVSGDPARVTFLDLAKAAACARRVTNAGARIAVLTTAAPDLGEGVQLLRGMDGPTGVKKLLAKHNPADRAAALLWAFAAKGRSLFLASGYPDDVVEELFATPIHAATEVQRLIDAGERVLIIPDAHKTMVTVG